MRFGRRRSYSGSTTASQNSGQSDRQHQPARSVHSASLSHSRRKVTGVPQIAGTVTHAGAWQRGDDRRSGIASGPASGSACLSFCSGCPRRVHRTAVTTTGTTKTGRSSDACTAKLAFGPTHRSTSTSSRDCPLSPGGWDTFGSNWNRVLAFANSESRSNPKRQNGTGSHGPSATEALITTVEQPSAQSVRPPWRRRRTGTGSPWPGPRRRARARSDRRTPRPAAGGSSAAGGSW